MWWLEDQDGKVRYLEETLDYVAAECGANMDQLWLVGYSGGSEFISRRFFPAYAERMPGGGFINFGGGDGARGESGGLLRRRQGTALAELGDRNP